MDLHLSASRLVRSPIGTSSVTLYSTADLKVIRCGPTNGSCGTDAAGRFQTSSSNIGSDVRRDFPTPVCPFHTANCHCATSCRSVRECPRDPLALLWPRLSHG